MKKCVGCGAPLQSKDKNKAGYIPEKTSEKTYCQRCFRLSHYHDFTNAYYQINPLDILKTLNQKEGFCFFLCDLVNINEESLFYYHQIKLPKVFVLSKTDSIPKNIYFEKLKNWLRTTGHIKEDILFVSEKTKKGLTKIKNVMTSRQDHPLYFLGMTNSGKSSLLNSLFPLENKLTISELPNTTLTFIKLPTKEFKVYDTPGFPYSFIYPESILKKGNPKSMLHPITMPLKKDASILIESLIRLETKEANSITCFFNKDLKPQKIYPNNPVYLEEEPLVYSFPKETNIYLKGLGFFYLKKAGQVKLYHVSKEQISIMPSFMGGKKESSDEQD